MIYMSVENRRGRKAYSECSDYDANDFLFDCGLGHFDQYRNDVILSVVASASSEAHFEALNAYLLSC
jgi:hypothetical protein